MYNLSNVESHSVFTTSVMPISTYSQNAYPFDRPVALSLTKLKALRSPNDANNSLTCRRRENNLEVNINKKEKEMH